MQTIVDPAETEELETQTDEIADTSVVSEENGFSNVKVMVIDDSKTIRRTAETLLKKEGFSE